jgi:hypothetical protein
VAGTQWLAPRAVSETAGLGAFYGTQPEEALGISILVLITAGGLAGHVAPGGGRSPPRPPWRWRLWCSG